MRKILANLSNRQRIAIAIMLALVGGSLFYLVQWKKEADFKPLFTGVAPEDATAIVQKLKESGTDYRLGDNGSSIQVPSARLNELRLTLAAAGLPKTGRIGFELFDKVNLGATEFAEHINYRRALEGELERTVMSLAEVEQARVHLTFPKESVFLEAQQPAKASVLVRLKPGKRLSPQNVLAIDHLVASAVEGLSPDAVSVLDMNGNLLGRPKPAGGLDGPEPSAATLDYRHQLESDLVTKIAATLGPLVGPDKFRAGVSVDCDFSGGDQSEEIFDPTRSAMATSQRTEDGAGGTGGSGIPGTASSLPRGSKVGAGSNRVTRSTENITYQTTRTVKRTHLPAGTIRKISLSVLVDQDVTWEKDGVSFKRVLVAPTPEKLKIIRDLVAGITGFNEERGDQLVIETLPFETTLLTEPPPSPVAPPTSNPAPPATFGIPLNLTKQQMTVAGSAIGGMIVLGIAAIVMMRKRSTKKKKKAAVAATPPEIAAPSVPAVPEGPVDAAAAAASANLEKQIESKIAERDALQAKMDEQALASLRLAPVITKKAEVFAKHLREKIAREPEISVQILRSWIREEEN